MTIACPICSNGVLEVLVSSERVEEELRLRREFYTHRIEGPPDVPEMKDRTDVLHATASAIHICRDCGVLVREPDGREFDDDRYAPSVMEQMLRAYIDAFHRKEPLYRSLLPPGSDVVEIGSYVGGFLHVATEWGWSASGIDVGNDTARFTAAHGYPTRRGSLAECAFDEGALDGVFIWNCFEQIDAPRPLLDEVRRVLRPGGALVIRTPNAALYAACEAMLESVRAQGTLTDHDPIVRLLAWNNFLGFPHRFGFGTRSLDSLVSPFGFTPIAHHGDTLMAALSARITPLARCDETVITSAVGALQHAIASFEPSVLATPWFEAVYRRAD